MQIMRYLVLQKGGEQEGMKTEKQMTYVVRWIPGRIKNYHSIGGNQVNSDATSSGWH